MTARHVARWLTLPLVVAIVLIGCGAPATPEGATTTPSTDPAAAPSTGTGSTGPSSGTGALPEPSAPAIDLVDPAGSMIAIELALLAADRERAGLGNLGPGALDLAAAIDASQARILADLRADAAAGILSGHLAAAGPPGAPGPLAPAPGFNAMLAWATLITTLGDFAREPRSGTVEGEPETVEIAGNTGTVTTTMTLNSAVSGSRLSVDITIKSKGSVVDRTTGAVLYSIDSIATGHVDVDFCPDARGQSAANVKLTSSEIYVQGGGAAKGVSKEFSGNATISVGDDANISRVEGAAQATEESKGGVPPAGSSESDLPVSTRQASDNIANDGSGARLAGVPRAIQFGGEGTTPEEQVKLWGSMSIIVETMVTAAAREAQKLWREGKCLELLVDPESRDVAPDEVLTVTAKVRHRIEGTELDKPVEATLAGVKTIDPAGERQPAPATVTYTAGSEDGDLGRIAFRSVSNRGIAEKAVTYTVRPAAWDVTFKGTDTEVFAIVKNALKADVTRLKITARDGVLTGTGRLRLRGKVTSGTCSGQLDQVVPITVKGTLVGSGADAKLQLTLDAPSPGGATIPMRCQPGGGADIPAEGHSERFGETLATFELPAATGTLEVSKRASIGGIMQVTIKGTFTVKRAR